MALGDNYNTNREEFFEPEVYSQYSMSNKDGVVDPSRLSVKFWKSLMKISIIPMLNNPTQEHVWDVDNQISVYINHTKARELYDGIDRVLDNSSDVHSWGVASSVDGLISFSDGKEVGLDSPCLIIRKVDQETGKEIASYVYEFHYQYHHAIVNYDPKSGNHDKVYIDSIEVEQFKELLRSYYESMTNATAYSVVVNPQFKRLAGRVDKIAEAVGVSTESKTNYSKKQGTSFFNKDNGNNNSPNGGGLKQATRTSTIEDIGSALNPPED